MFRIDNAENATEEEIVVVVVVVVGLVKVGATAHNTL